MPDIGQSPQIVPYGADQTIYLVVDGVGVSRQIEWERSDLDGVITELLSGRFNAPLRIIAFNTLEHWRRDISKDVADEIRERCDIEGISVPDHLSDFLERQMTRA